MYKFVLLYSGHAHCHVDAGLGNIKKLYRRTDCESLSQLEEIVNKSSMSNLAVRYPQWIWRKWKEFLDEVFKPLKHIRYLTLKGINISFIIYLSV